MVPIYQAPTFAWGISLWQFFFKKIILHLQLADLGIELIEFLFLFTGLPIC